MITPGTPVLLTKLSTQNPGVLPDAYWLKGVLHAPITIGSTIQILRTERAARESGEVSPVKVTGIYVSSPVEEILEQGEIVTARTRNSHWRIAPLSEKGA